MKTTAWSSAGALALLLALAPSVPAQGPLGLPGVVKSRNQAVLTRAINNARQLALAMIEFDSEFAQFPSAETAADVAKQTGKEVPLKPKTSQDFFQQFVAAGYLADLGFTSWETPKPGEEPDPSKSFAYVGGASTASNASRPVLIAPLAADGESFDPKPFNGKAVVLRVDGSCVALPINADGKVIVNDLDLLDPKQPYFGGQKPQLHLPAAD